MEVNLSATQSLRGIAQGGGAAFLGIPFGQPPIGSLRFQQPLPAQPWTGVRDATSFAAACAQDINSQYFTGKQNEYSEDCLYLNVFRPAHANDTAMLPVLVWIFGGGFTRGASSQRDINLGDPYYPPRAFFEASSAFNGSQMLTEPAIIITFNYRLSALGWLAVPSGVGPWSSSPGQVTGNAGAGDMLLALKWVQDHISRFGGDPRKVVLFGESAGAFAVCALLATEASGGLFSGGISESGTCGGLPPELGGQAAWRPSVAAAFVEKLYNELPACRANRTISCLQAVPSAAVVSAASTLEQPALLEGSFVWGPTVDGVIWTTADFSVPVAAHRDSRLIAGTNAAEVPDP